MAGGKIAVGLIGCGGFARGTHIPNLRANPKFVIRAAGDLDPGAARTVAEETGAAFWTDDPGRIFDDDGIDLVIISTRHDSHADLSVRAAEAGKHVLCEKPIGLDRAQCRAVAEAVRKNRVKYTVGYNRGLAPLVARAQDLLAGRPEKKLIYHRIQAPFPPDSWTHDPAVGGGRFVGEGCHIFDLLCRLAGSAPVSVHAAGGTFLDPARVRVPDSGIITINFADGSVGATLIASAGCAAFPKESTEIYCAGRAIHISDFRVMEYFGFEGQERVRVELGARDKGHALELDRLADAILNDTEPPGGPEIAARAAVISYLAGESLAAGIPLPVAESDWLFR